jgi:integrase
VPTFVKRGGRIRAQVRLRGHRSQSRTFAKQRDAAAWARETEAALRAGEALDDHTLHDAIDVYLASDASAHLSGYEQSVLAWWGNRLGNKRLADLKGGDFHAARDAMTSARGHALRPASKNRRVSFVAAALTHAMRLDWITHNPARIRRLPEDNLVERPVTPAELDRLLAACAASPEPALHPMVACAISSAARAGELQRLVWRDVDLGEGIAGLLRTKSGRRRPIAIRGRALERLRAIRAALPDTDETNGRHVFVHADGRAPFEYGRSWRAARAVAGVPDLRFHDLRHLAASTLAEAGTSTRELMAFLGHSNPSTTARYAHLVDRHIVQLGDVLAERLLGGASA